MGRMDRTGLRRKGAIGVGRGVRRRTHDVRRRLLGLPGERADARPVPFVRRWPDQRLRTAPAPNGGRAQVGLPGTGAAARGNRERLRDVDARSCGRESEAHSNLGLRGWRTGGDGWRIVTGAGPDRFGALDRVSGLRLGTGRGGCDGAGRDLALAGWKSVTFC